MDAPVTHPPADVLEAFGSGRLDDTLATAVSKHIETCVECCKAVASLSGDDFLAQLRAADRTGPSGPKLPRGASAAPASSAKSIQPSDHPSPDTLRAYSAGKLDESAAAAVLAHLEKCFECCKNAATLSGDMFLDQFRAGDKEHAAAAKKVLEHYQIIRELGRGGMGVVYLATNTLMERLEVLKVVNRQVLDQAGGRERFLREIRSAAKLSHPNIVTAYAAFEIGDSLLLAMEYVNGEDLGKTVKAQGALPVLNACFYARQAALGLQHAFEKGMVHRDIKPHNLILTRNGKKHVVKILDFGLAKARRQGEATDHELTATGKMLGTPDYIAPEQTLDAASADIRADIYSLGCTLYYLLSGGPPFRAKSLFELLQAHMSQQATPLDKVRPDIPAKLAEAIAKMMAKDPAARYQTPAEVVQVLTPFIRPAGNSVEAKSSPDEKGKSPGRETALPVAARIDTMSEEQNLIAKPRERTTRSRRPAKPSASKKIVAAIAIVAFVLAVALGGWILRIRTPDGDVIIEVNEPGAEVYIEGKRMEVKWDKGRKRAVISALKNGVKVVVEKDGITAEGPKITLDEKGRKLFTFEFRKNPAAGQKPEMPDKNPAVVVEKSKHAGEVPTLKPLSEDSDGWVQLFNGKDKTGWQVDPPECDGDWQVKNGILVWSSRKSSHLKGTQNHYPNFHLHVETRISDSQYAQVKIGSNAAILNSNNPNGYKTGSLAVRGKPVQGVGNSPVPPGQWFTVEIIAEGNRVVVKVNGQTTANYVDPDWKLGEATLVSLAAFNQIEASGRYLEFRKVEIRELKTIENKGGLNQTNGAANVGKGPELGRLLEVLKAADREEQLKVVVAIANLGPDAGTAVRPMIDLLEKSNAELRRALVFALGNIGPAAEPAVPILVSRLADPKEDKSVRMEISVTLARIGAPATRQSLPTLLELLADKNEDKDVRWRILWALRVHTEAPGVTNALAAVLREPKRVGVKMLRYDCAYLLGMLEGQQTPEQALDALLDFLKDDKVRLYDGTQLKESGQIEELGKADARVMAVDALTKVGPQRLASRPDIVQQLRSLADNSNLNSALRNKSKELLSTVEQNLKTAGGVKPAQSGPEMPSSKGFVQLFNGKDLKGWHVVGPTWLVRNGELVGKGDKTVGSAAVLETNRKDLSNFHLRIEIVSSGRPRAICLRNTVSDGFSGYLVETGGFTGQGEFRPAGSIGRIRAPWPKGFEWENLGKTKPLKDGDSYVLEIVAKGNDISTFMNGEFAAECKDEITRAPSGSIRLICWAGTGEARFRKIEIKEPGPRTVDASVCGTWHARFQDGEEGEFPYYKDGTMTGTNQFSGKWRQEGRKVEVVGSKPNAATSTWKGEIAPNGRSMTLTCGIGMAQCLRRGSTTGDTSVIGIWGARLQDGVKGECFYYADGTMTGLLGFSGTWRQEGRKVQVVGSSRNEATSTWKGEVAPDGRSMSLTCTSGTRLRIQGVRSTLAYPPTHGSRERKRPETLKIEGDLVTWAAKGADFVELRQWEKAAQAYDKAFELEPTEPFLWFENAYLRLQIGDSQGYRKLCARMLERFGKSNEILESAMLAHTCVLASGALGDVTRVRQLAERRLALTQPWPRHHIWSEHILGLAHYRAREYGRAITCLEKSVKEHADWEYKMLNELVLAMAHHKLKHAALARQWLDKARQGIDQTNLNRPQSGGFAPPGWAWRDWLGVQMLQREAQILIEKMANTKDMK